MPQWSEVSDLAAAPYWMDENQLSVLPGNLMCDGAFGFGLKSIERPCTPNTDFSNIIKVHTKKGQIEEVRG